MPMARSESRAIDPNDALSKQGNQADDNSENDSPGVSNRQGAEG